LVALNLNDSTIEFDSPTRFGLNHIDQLSHVLVESDKTNHVISNFLSPSNHQINIPIFLRTQVQNRLNSTSIFSVSSVISNPQKICCCRNPSCRVRQVSQVRVGFSEKYPQSKQVDCNYNLHQL